jgi:hypothetical protein
MHCPLLSSAFTTLLPSVKRDDRLKNKRKIVLRQAEAHLSHAVWIVREEIHVEKGWRTPAKRALLERTALQYQSASGSHKQRILARFVTVTGYVRKCAVGCSLMGQASPLLVFASERCTTGLPLPKETAGSPLQHGCQELLEDTSVLNWRRTCKDPFVEQWEQILSWMQADPTRTSMRKRNYQQLRSWMEEANESGISELKSFVAGIERDYDAVKEALRLPWSQGVTEGKVNKLKTIKRQMYGRAGFPLLRQRLLHDA